MFLTAEPSIKIPKREGHLGGSVVEHLPSAQVGSGHAPRVLGSGPTSGSPQGACFSLCLCLCLSLVSLMNKENLFKKIPKKGK